MSQTLTINEADRLLTNKALGFTTKEKLVELFGEKDSYEIADYLNITAISNKAFYKLNDEELFYLNARSSVAFKALKAYYTRRAEAVLGFDFNSNFGLVKEDNFNIQSLSDFEDGEVNQEVHIPLNQDLVNKIISAEKFKVDVKPSTKSKLSDYGRQIQYYLCQVDGQVVPIAFVERQMPIHNTDPVRYSQSVSMFILLKGTVPFFVSRLDFDPFNKHTNRLENGKIATGKIKSRGTHQHIYSERFAVLVPTLKRIMHCDAESYDFIHTFEDAKLYLEKQMNISQNKNPNLENIFKNDILKAQRQKKYKSNNKKIATTNLEDLNFNF